MDEGNTASTVTEAAEAQVVEATAGEPTTAEIQGMYDDLGVKAKAPAAKGRPKSTGARAKDAAKDGDGDSTADEKGNAKSQSKSEDAPDSDKDGDAGNPTDTESEKKRKADGKVSDKPEEASGDVRKTEPESSGNTERRSEEGSDGGDNDAGQADDDEGGEKEEGKRPGKSDPKVERRFQKLTSEVRERDDYISKLEKELNEARQKHTQSQVDAEDPKYTIDDFRRVRDEQGNVLDLDEDQAELAFRRWQDGYNQRQSERDAEMNHQQTIEQNQRAASEQLMQSSVSAYDALVELYESTPELNETSGKFDKEFSDSVMPLIKESIIYQEGTEPGNADGYQPIIIGMKMNPDSIVKAMNAMRQTKRSLPLNGTTDSVESPSTIGYTKGRSSDETINAANDLYKQLGIKKRL